MMYKMQSLNGTWNLWKSGQTEALGVSQVPGSVLTALLAQEKIEDPFWRCNEYRIRELLTEDFTFEREFYVESIDFDSIHLICEGLDTVASIEINGIRIAQTDDMHRIYVFQVKEFLKVGDNHIGVHFSSALVAAREEDAENDIFYASTGSIHGNGAIRKAHYMFGWDWGPQLPDAGIFRDIRLEYTSQIRIEDWIIKQEHGVDGHVTLQIDTCLSMMKKQESVGLAVTIEDPEGTVVTEEYPYQERISMEIKQPKLWWPNGIGEHPLYGITLELRGLAGEVYDRQTRRIGLRTIGICQDFHEWGREFAFEVNGIKLFAMGANYIPEDSLIPRVNRNRTRKLIKDCERANFNCLRVWGGGYYPEDYFYDACDEAGILIWQDLMFACNVYAWNPHFEENIVKETKDQVKRMRHHACLALWCGNNEMEWGWGDEWARIKGHHPRYKADYTKIFEYILPKALKSCDEETFFWPSSPSSGGSFDDPNGENRGDQHYWDVWHSGKPFTEYRKHYFSFCSEYGFQSFPGMKTIGSFTLPEDRNIFSKVMESHQKNGAANGKILNYVADYFLYPKSLDALAYISQILQLKAIQYGVEHWRRNRGRCMGSLYWQLNDCWPVASWASIDYFGRWKALHYGARKFYAPVMVSACEEEELSTRISYYVNNDTRNQLEGSVEIALVDADFQVLRQESVLIQVPAMSVIKVMETDWGREISSEEKRHETFARVRLLVDGLCVSEQVTLFVKPKHFHYKKPNYQVTVKEEEAQFQIHVRSGVFAQYVELDFEELDGIFSNNYFDITNEEGVLITLMKSEISTVADQDTIKKQLKVRSIADSYEVGLEA